MRKVNHMRNGSIMITPLPAIPEDRDDGSSFNSFSEVNKSLESSDAGFSSSSNDSPQAKRNNELELHGFDFSRPLYEDSEARNPITNVIHNSSEFRKNIDQTIQKTQNKSSLEHQEYLSIQFKIEVC